MIEDNWTTIRNVMVKHDWIDSKTIKKETGMQQEIIARTLRAQVNHGTVEKNFINHNTSHQWNGGVKRYKFVWRLIK